MRHDYTYLNLLDLVMDEGVPKPDRTGTGTKQIFGYQAHYSMSDGFPLLTTKKMAWKSIVHELVWFLRGRTDNKFLTDRKVTIWNEWSTAEQCARFGRPEGDLGPIYGRLWSNFGATTDRAGVNQLKRLCDLLRSDPHSRRLLVSGWDPQTCDTVALPPCHTVWQCNVSNGMLDLQLYQRSC